MLLRGIDIGTSSVKVSVVDGLSGLAICSTHYPEKEAGIKVLFPGWAEQSPDSWWDYTRHAIKKLHSFSKYDPKDLE